MGELAEEQPRGGIQILLLKGGKEIELEGSFPIGQPGLQPTFRALQPLVEAASEPGQLGEFRLSIWHLGTDRR